MVRSQNSFPVFYWSIFLRFESKIGSYHACCSWVRHKAEARSCHLQKAHFNGCKSHALYHIIISNYHILMHFWISWHVVYWLYCPALVMTLSGRLQCITDVPPVPCNLACIRAPTFSKKNQNAGSKNGSWLMFILSVNSSCFMQSSLPPLNYPLNQN